MPAPSVIRFRVDPELREKLDRLRKEKSVNVSSWLRRLVQQGLEQEFPDDETAVATESSEQSPARDAGGHGNDQKQSPAVATEATQSDSSTTPPEVADPPQNGSDTMPIVATESLGQEGPEQPEHSPARGADGHGNDRKQSPAVATEATQSDSSTTPPEVAEPPKNGPDTMPIVAAEDTAQSTPIPGWKPRKLTSGEWGAALEGEMVAELPDNEQLPGTPIVVTDKRGESWIPTLTEVVDRTDNTIVVKNSGRTRS